MAEPDLFGHVAPERPITYGTHGYARQPGSGPTGETCGTCEHYLRVHRGAGVYLKCALMEPSWTRGRASDIKKKAPACSMWQKAEE